MNSFMNKMERKFGKYAIHNLTLYVIAIYIIGYILQIIPGDYSSFLTLNPYLILHGQVWRLVTWVLIPPTGFSIFVIFTLYLYYFMGTTMERTMGTFRYNVFFLGGCLFMIIASFLTYGVYYLMVDGNAAILAAYMQASSGLFSTYYIQEMVFLSFAICYPDVKLLLMFFLPIRVKWLGIVYAAMLAYEAAFYGIFGHQYAILIVILLQFLNLFLFYLQTGRASHLAPKQVKRRQEYKRNAQIRPRTITRHKCAVCGRTEKEFPDLEFRFCAKCNGNYEYCQDHLFTHQHVQ